MGTGGKQLWIDCLAGKPAAFKKMAKYNRQDVDLLRDVYLELRPWAKSHPNMALLGGDPEACPKCGSAELIRRGYRHTQTGRYPALQCKRCGGYSRSRLMEPDTVRPGSVN